MPEITEQEYTAAIETLDRVYGGGASDLMEMIVAVRDQEIVHRIDEATATRGDDWECVPDCGGCMSERIADAVTKAVNLLTAIKDAR